MEEWVGSIWHRFISQKSQVDFEHERVEFKQVYKSAGIIFRALGGDPAKQVEAVTPREYIVRRNLLQKMSGSHQQQSLAWQDPQSLRLPESIALFPCKSLNKSLYFWLAALAAHSPDKFTHWAIDNQRIVKDVLNKYPSLQVTYQQLVAASLALRPPVATLEKSQQALELSIIRALKEPGSVSHFPAANYAPHAVFLWLYPNAKVALEAVNNDLINLDAEQQEGDPDIQKSSQGRKKTERVDSDNSKDSLVVFRLESLFSWSEFSKVNRAMDDTENHDAKRVAEDLDMLSLAKKTGQKSAKLKIDLDLPSAAEDDIPLGKGISLPEWDYKSNLLVPDRCLIQPMLPKNAQPQGIPEDLRALANKIKNQFEHLKSLKHWQKGQDEGEELDLNAWLDFHISSQIGATKDSGLYNRQQSKIRDIGCLLLSDLSMSTGAYIDNDNKVIDVIKTSLLLFGEALTAVGDNFAMYGFSSVKRHHVRFSILKNFTEKYSDEVRGRILSLRPGFYTRMGAAIRQATQVLETQRNKQKLLLILTDGKPNDLDHYEGRFGVEDTRQAILEAKKKGLIPFCITIDHKAEQYMPYIFGTNGYSVILHPGQLPTKLPLLYHQLTA